MLLLKNVFVVLNTPLLAGSPESWPVDLQNSSIHILGLVSLYQHIGRLL